MNSDLLSLDLFRWWKPETPGNPRTMEITPPGNANPGSESVRRRHSRPTERERPDLGRRIISGSGKEKEDQAASDVPQRSISYSAQFDGISYEGRESYAPQLRNHLSAPAPPRTSWVNAIGQTSREHSPGDTGRPGLPMSYPHHQAIVDIRHSFVRPLQPPTTRFAFGQSPASLREALEEERGDDEKWPPAHEPDTNRVDSVPDDELVVLDVPQRSAHRRSAADHVDSQEDWDFLEQGEIDAEVQNITGIGEGDLTFYRRLTWEYLTKLGGLMVTSVEGSARYPHSRQEKAISKEAWHYIGHDWRSV